MRTSSVFRCVGAALLSLATVVGCRFERPESNPAVLAAPTSPDDSPEATRETVLRAARSDLQCGDAGIVMTLDRRYANGAALRFIVDGCGRRALYAESCEEYPICRYVLVSVVPVPVYAAPAAHGASSAVPSGSANPWPPAGSGPSGASSAVPASSTPARPGTVAPVAPAPAAPHVPATAPSASTEPAPVVAPPAKPASSGNPVSL